MTEPTIAVADVAVDDNEVADIAVANIAVADLARFCHRSGDIDQRFKAAPTGAQGVAGHQRVYARRPASYRSEYAVAYQHSEPGLQLTLRGRADGYDAEQGLVEEIKTCRGAPDALPEAVAQLHFAQGRLYAAIIAAQGETDALTVRVTWLTSTAARNSAAANTARARSWPASWPIHWRASPTGCTR